MKLILSFCLLFFSLFSFLSCSNDDEDDHRNNLKLEIYENQGWTETKSASIDVGENYRIRILNTPFRGKCNITTENNDIISVEPDDDENGIWIIKSLNIGKTVINVQTSDDKSLSVPFEIAKKTLKISTEDSYTQILGIDDNRFNDILYEVKKGYIPAFSLINLTYTSYNSGDLIISDLAKTDSISGDFEFDRKLHLKMNINKTEYIYDILYNSPFSSKSSLRNIGKGKVYLVSDITSRYKDKYPDLISVKIIVIGYIN